MASLGLDLGDDDMLNDGNDGSAPLAACVDGTAPLLPSASAGTSGEGGAADASEAVAANGLDERLRTTVPMLKAAAARMVSVDMLEAIAARTVACTASVIFRRILMSTAKSKCCCSIWQRKGPGTKSISVIAKVAWYKINFIGSQLYRKESELIRIPGFVPRNFCRVLLRDEPSRQNRHSR